MWKKQNLKVHLPVSQQSSPHLSFSDSHFHTESQRANTPKSTRIRGARVSPLSTGLPPPVSSLNLPPEEKHPLVLRNPAGEGSGVSRWELNPIR